MISTNNSFTNHIYLTYMYKQDLALNKLQGLICHKTQPNHQPYTAKELELLQHTANILILPNKSDILNIIHKKCCLFQL